MQQLTKKAIVDSFVSLLNRYSLDKITIKDIVDDCGVNRSTFYYHFEDIRSLLDYIFKTETEKALTGVKDYTNWRDGANVAVQFALQNKRAIYHIYHSVSRETLEEYLYRVVDDMVLTVVRREAEGTNAGESDIRIVTDIYKYVVIGMILVWLKNDMKVELTDQLDRVSDLLEGNVHTILLRASDK